MEGSFALVTSVSFSAAFFGGLLSFFSPCIFPVMPGFIGYLMGGTREKWDRVWRGFGFIFGLSLVFILLGALTGAFGSLFVQVERWVAWIGGSIIILLGFAYLGWFRLPRLQLVRKSPARAVKGFWGAFFMGVAISFVWVPCVSPVLGSILTIAAQSGSISRGSALLALYALGFSIPLFFVSVFLSILYRWIPWIMNHEKALRWIGGLLLIVVGILMVTGLLNTLQLG